MGGFDKVKACLPQNAGLQCYDLFYTKATAVNAEVFRVATADEAVDTAQKIIKELGVKKAASVPLSLVNGEKLVKVDGVSIKLGQPPRKVIEEAELGITEFELAVAETGSLAQDATDVYKRLISSLPPYHLAFVKTEHIVATFADALDVLYKVNGNQMPGYVAYISGPSRTADIERVLAIGVHGPERVFIICIG
ncbi:MAG: Lactate utilization protein [Peptococcaceae bacterium]|jgi:L-lactate dehydrogenase complex protein LldG|nr:Lactate utilization protein [Peptococcaceae bacterium]